MGRLPKVVGIDVVEMAIWAKVRSDVFLFVLVINIFITLSFLFRI